MRNMRKFGALAVGVFVLLAVYLFGFSLPAGKRTKLHVGNAVFEVEVADTPARRGQGLSGKTGLKDKEGMLFIFDTPARDGFWMREMKFALDFVWILDGQVVGVTENVQPEPEKSLMNLTIYYPPKAVNQVLEVNAGAAAKFGMKIGDKVSLSR